LNRRGGFDSGQKSKLYRSLQVGLYPCLFRKLLIKKDKMKAILVHPNSDLLIKEVETEGFNWGAFLLGIIWYGIYGVWGKFWLYLFLSILISTFTFGIGFVFLWFVMGFRFNKEYFEFLLEKGYKLQTKNEN